MKIISHRGYWKRPSEKNSMVAFARSFDLGYGTETDVRDLSGSLVISHDPPLVGATTFDQFLAAVGHRGLPLALNVKADGLAVAIRERLDQFSISSAFVFDMAVPDMRSYFSAGVPVFTRMSEVERDPVWLDRAAGLWLDGFDSVWYDAQLVERHIDAGREVCVVSPELHGREHLACWEMLRGMPDYSGLILCTDLPEEATDFWEEAT